MDARRRRRTDARHDGGAPDGGLFARDEAHRLAPLAGRPSFGWPQVIGSSSTRRPVRRYVTLPRQRSRPFRKRPSSEGLERPRGTCPGDPSTVLATSVRRPIASGARARQ